MMKEFFIVANSNAAPFVSDKCEQYMQGKNAHHALARFIARYNHPAGLFAARVFESADAFYKQQPFLAEWLSQRAARQCVEGETF